MDSKRLKIEEMDQFYQDQYAVWQKVFYKLNHASDCKDWVNNLCSEIHDHLPYDLYIKFLGTIDAITDYVRDTELNYHETMDDSIAWREVAESYYEYMYDMNIPVSPSISDVMAIRARMEGYVSHSSSTPLGDYYRIKEAQEARRELLKQKRETEGDHG